MRERGHLAAVRVTATAARSILCGARRTEGFLLRWPNLRRSDQQQEDKAAGGWLSLRLSPLDAISETAVGRTGFEPVTSSVSGKSRTVSGVCRRQPASFHHGL